MIRVHVRYFFFNDTATTEIYTLTLHDALPISPVRRGRAPSAWGAAHAVIRREARGRPERREARLHRLARTARAHDRGLDRKSTRLNSSHANISYAVFCLKKKNTICCLILQHAT